MPSLLSHQGRHLFNGTLWVFLAEALVLPTGIITAAFLTRRLGPEGYGIFSIAAAIIILLELSVTSVFSRPSFKFIAEAADWRPLGTTLLWWHTVTGFATSITVWVLSPVIARILHEPALMVYLNLFALDIPLFSIAQAHKNLLIGLGAFRQRAITSIGRWTIRLLLILLLVESGFSINGAILGSLGATFAELILARIYVGPLLTGSVNFRLPGFWNYAWPLWLFSLGMTLFGKLDLLMLKAFGGTASQAGVYGAAQNLAVAPGIVAMAFSPLLLSTLTRLKKAGEEAIATQVGSDALRLVILLLPFAAMTAGMGPELAEFVFGALFLPAGALLAVLIFGAVAMAMISVATAIMIANGSPKWPLMLIVPLVVFSTIGHSLLIPMYGAAGASVVTTLFGSLGAVAAVLVVANMWGVRPSTRTLQRSILVSSIAFVLSSFWVVSTGFVILKVALISAVICASLIILGEFSATEIAHARDALLSRTTAAPVP